MRRDKMTTFKILFAGIGGVMSYLLGGFDMLISALLTFVVIDYITGILAAWINCELSSHVGFNGIIKKICIFLAVAVAECITHVTGVNGLRDIAVSFYIANEGLSILENLGRIGVPLPEKLIEVLKQLKNNK